MAAILLASLNSNGFDKRIRFETIKSTNSIEYHLENIDYTLETRPPLTVINFSGLCQISRVSNISNSLLTTM